MKTHSHPQFNVGVDPDHLTTPKANRVVRKSERTKLEMNSEMDTSKIDYLANHHISRSFNSLIIDDDIESSTPSTQRNFNIQMFMRKTPINKSPSFNLKATEEFSQSTQQDEMDDFHSPSLSIIKPKKLFNNEQFDLDTDDDLSIGEDDEENDGLVENTIENLTSHVSTPSTNQSIKRSSKFFNLSIDSNVKKQSPLSYQNIHDIESDFDNDEDETKLQSMKIEPLILDKSTPFKKNYKRPHILISQSPSPSSGGNGIKFIKNQNTDSLVLRTSSPPPKQTADFKMRSTSHSEISKSSQLHKLRKTSLPPLNFQFNENPFNNDDESPSKLKKASKQNTDKSKKKKNYINNPDEEDKENDGRFITPTSYKLVRPLQTAFSSSGLMKKTLFKEHTNTPDTPCKRNPMLLTPHSMDSTMDSEAINNQDLKDCINQFTDDFNQDDSIFRLTGTPTKSTLSKSRSLPDYTPHKPKILNLKNWTKFIEPTTPLTKTHEHYFESVSCPQISKSEEPVDDHLASKFDQVAYLGRGEYSVVYECVFQGNKYAIKRSKKQLIGSIERKNFLREVEILRELTYLPYTEGKEYVINFVESWAYDHYYYTMLEYCENGTLSKFLLENKNQRLDEFRIWKILVEIMTGVKYLHENNVLHLDLKPDNIFITFEGSLKIGDFGLSTKFPVESSFDMEGDRNYIAPELINEKNYTSFADIFSIGLIILEIAANIILPDNGTPWRKLRSGDLSDAGKLSSDNISGYLQNSSSSVSNYSILQQSSTSSIDYHMLGKAVPTWAPFFLIDNNGSLDKLVERLLKPNPYDRFSASQVLGMEECLLVESRRKAGALIFEGEFGPGPEEVEDE